ncbi:polyphosphate polymerase domain-containing protein [Haloferula chungangensis]|uniref:Polyphosphate polymerase domain-containing protein n=1 Tax=Haloferula chungangensis TaxID=1048331 RepID=A0ABW2L6A5_9BACT
MDIRQARRELKFHLKAEQGEAVLAAIKAMLPGDANGAVGGAYPIISEYYDTDDRDAYWERNRRQPNRRKLRVRIYGTSNGVIPPSAFLEVKHKCDGVGVKRRIRVPLEVVSTPGFDVAELMRGMRREFTRRDEILLAEEVLRLVEVKGVKPAMQMRYDRLAFEGPDNVRVTFDTAIKCRTVRQALLPDDPDFPHVVMPPGERVLELKLFGSAPYWLRELGAKHGLLKTPFSKYCSALEFFDPIIMPIVGRMTRRLAAPAI